MKASPSGVANLWVTDGTTAGTQEIAVDGASPYGLDPEGLTVLGNQVFFVGEDAHFHEGLGHEGLWVTDGTAAGTHEIAVIGADLSESDGFNPYPVQRVGDVVVFLRYNANQQPSVWETDGTTLGRYVSAELDPLVGNFPYNFAPLPASLPRARG